MVEDDAGESHDGNEHPASDSDDGSMQSGDETEESSESTLDDDSDDDDDDSEGNSKDQGDYDDEEEEDDGDDESENDQEGVEVGDAEASFEGFQSSGLVPLSSSGEQCTFDLRNLLAINAHQIDKNALYSSKIASEQQETIAIPPERLDVSVDEGYLLDKAREGCTQLISALWQLPKEESDAGPLAVLPPHDASRIPRSMPPPPPRKETKWEKFAKEKGLPLNKSKRSQKVWDEATGTWLYRHGYQKANDAGKEWPIIEVKGNDDPYEDPWEKQREAKRGRVERNVESRMRNEERAGHIAKGTTTHMMKSHDKVRKAGKAGGDLDRDHFPPPGIPVDLKSSKAGGSLISAKRGKQSTSEALLNAQRSTASMGKFDKVVEGEPERKKIASSVKKRKYESATDKKVLSTETERSLKLLKSVVEGGGVAKEKARTKGKLAKGETAYDYDFDDGLGPSTFKKKKGRAGAGKMKKMTKKRAK